MFAAKFGDVVLGIDIHAVTLPPPAPPAPTPLPHPFIGVVFDPLGALIGAAIGAIFGGGGPVFVNGLPTGNTGTEVKGSPHFPTPPGVAPHPSDAPTGNEGSLITGSKTVNFAGSSQSRLGSMVMSCNFPINLPTSVCLAVPMGAPVMIGGPEAIDFIAAATQAIRTKWVSNKLHELLGATKGSWRSKIICFLTGHPVDVMTGELIAEAVDFELPGTIPLSWERNYRSRQTTVGALGAAWTHPFDDFVEETDEGVIHRMADGRPKTFPYLAEGQSDWDGEDRYALTKTRTGYELRTWDGQRRIYERVPDNVRFVLTAVKDPAENAVKLRYDKGRLTEVLDTAGRVLEVRWTQEKQARLEGIYLNGEELVRYRYDSQGMLAAAVDPLGHALEYAYQGGVMVQETHKGGLSFHFAWTEAHPEGWCVRTWGENPDAPEPPRGSKARRAELAAAEAAHVGVPRFIFDRKITYDTERHFTSVEDGRGGITQYWGNALGLVEKQMDPAGNVTEYVWDKFCRKLSEKDPLGNEQRFDYDERGNCVWQKDAAGGEVRRHFGDDGILLELVDAAGATWKVDWDKRRRPAWVVGPDGAATRYEHDEQGRLLRVEDAMGRVTRLEWGQKQEVKEVRDGEGNATRFAYDNKGRVVGVVDAAGREAKAQRDAMGRVVSLDRADGERLSLSYDAEGNLVERVDSEGRRVVMRYSGMGRLVWHQDPLGHQVRLGYDSDEALTLVENQASERYTFELDVAGRVKRETAFDGIEHRYIYDKASRPSRVLGPNNRVVFLEHDALGRLTKRKLRDEEEAFAYDARGQLVEAKTKTTSVVFDRDSHGRIVAERHGDGTEVGSRYDPSGLRITRETSLWHQTDYAWDKTGELAGMSHGWSPKASAPGLKALGLAPFQQDPWSMTIARDPLGQELARRLPGGVVALWKRDRLGRPERREVLTGAFPGKEAAQLSRVGYQWRGADEISALIDTKEGPTRYEHDPRGHLIRAMFADGEVQHRASDAVSNLFKTADKSDRVYGKGGRLERVGNTELRYDHEGRLTEKVLADGASWKYVWTEAGRLAKVVRPDGQEVRFVYDALGRRVRKEFGEAVTEYVWDGDDLVHERVTKAGEAQPLVTWLFEPGTFAPVAKIEGKKRYGVVTDHLGTPTMLVTEAGKLAWKAQLDVWGVPREAKEGVSEKDRTDNPWRYPGQYEDAETGLYYNRFRYFDPEAGRYISPDPIGLLGGLPVYGYVGSPALDKDPLGLAAHVPSGPMAGKRVGHTFTKHGSHNTEQLLREAIGSGRAVGQWLDDAAVEHLIADNLDKLANGAIDIPIPPGLGRVILPDGTMVDATMARLVPSGSGVKTAYPHLGCGS